MGHKCNPCSHCTLFLTDSLWRLWTVWCCHHDWLGWDSGLWDEAGTRDGGGQGPCYVLVSLAPALTKSAPHAPMSPRQKSRNICVWRPLEVSICCLKLSLVFTWSPRGCQDSVYDDMVTLLILGRIMTHPDLWTGPHNYPTFPADLRAVSGCDAVHRLHWNWSLIFTKPQIKPNTMPPTNNKNGN